MSGCFPSRQLIRCSVCGNKITSLLIKGECGFLMKIDCHLPSSTFPRMTLTHRRQQSAQPTGLVTPVHFSETCDEDLPRLITQVTTTSAPSPDRHALPEVHETLQERELLPEQHLVDAGD